MADYFTHFACRIDLGTPARAAEALALLVQMREHPGPDGPPRGFNASIDPERPTYVFMDDGGGYGEPGDVIAFVLACAEVFDLQGRWGFVWAMTCSRSDPDGFGGGAQLIDLSARQSLEWVDCADWLLTRLDP